MNLKYVYTRIEEDMRTSGEARKAQMQVDALVSNSVNAELYIHNRYVPWNKFLIRIPFYPIYSNAFARQLIRDLQSADAVYIRKYVIDQSFIRLLRKVRITYPDIKIIYEIPTYPYDKEWESIEDRMLLIKDRIYRKALCRYIDRIVTFSDDAELFHVKCICTSNGIDPAKIPVRKITGRKENEIHMIGVATLEKWHGYDRIIKGLRNYYNGRSARKVFFHIVGDGAEFNSLRRLSERLQMQENVFFHGRMQGERLTDLFNQCDIGIGSLGMHRIGLQKGYTLKLREYVARGIPFVYGYDDLLIEKYMEKYSFKVANDDSDIDIDAVVRFYNNLSAEDDTIGAMNDVANKYLSWTSQMKPVAEYLKNS